MKEIVNVKRNSRTRNTNFKSNYNSCSLTIFDYEFRQAIKPYIPVGRKSNTISPPVNLPGYSEKDYIRGLIDSDGSLGITSENKPFISLCTQSEKIKDFILNSIFQVTGSEKRLTRNIRDGIYNISIFNEDAVLYTKYLYENSELYLDRKYNKYVEIISWIRTIPKKSSRTKTWLESEDLIIKDKSLSIKEKMSILNRSEDSIRMRYWRLSNR